MNDLSAKTLLGSPPARISGIKLRNDSPRIFLTPFLGYVLPVSNINQSPDREVNRQSMSECKLATFCVNHNTILM